MLRYKIALTSLLMLLCELLVVPVARAQEALVVRGYLFYSATCDHCQWVRQEVIPPLYREFGQQLQITAVEIPGQANYQWWQDAARTYGVAEADLDVPTLLMGKDVLVGGDPIGAEMRALIQKYLDQGGVDYPEVPRPAAAPANGALYVLLEPDLSTLHARQGKGLSAAQGLIRRPLAVGSLRGRGRR